MTTGEPVDNCIKQSIAGGLIAKCPYLKLDDNSRFEDTLTLIVRPSKFWRKILATNDIGYVSLMYTRDGALEALLYRYQTDRTIHSYQRVKIPLANPNIIDKLIKTIKSHFKE